MLALHSNLSNKKATICLRAPWLNNPYYLPSWPCRHLARPSGRTRRLSFDCRGHRWSSSRRCTRAVGSLTPSRRAADPSAPSGRCRDICARRMEVLHVYARDYKDIILRVRFCVKHGGAFKYIFSSESFIFVFSQKHYSTPVSH